MKLKKWVIYLIMFINIIALMLACADFNDMLTFHLVHIVSIAILITNTFILKKYTNIFE